VLRWLRNKWERDLVTMRERKVKAAQQHRDRKILCPRCGYDIKGAPDQPCSECGLFIESGWSEGRFAAGSAGRIGALWGMVAGSLHILILGMGGWLLVFVKTGVIREMLPYAPLLYLAIAALVAHWLIAVGILAIAILRRRWLIYGPRSYAASVLIKCCLLAIGTNFIAHRVWLWVTATMAG
jgi:hypothetical protein